MSKPSPKKIDLNPRQSGLAQPFAGLEAAGLPEGPALPPPTQVAEKTTAPAMKGRVLLRKETAHRGGKAVIVVHELPTHLHPVEIENLAKKLRQACGCGGTVKERTIEMQGDQPGKVRAFLEELGFKVGGVK